jgi:hypothetical protein
MRSRLIGFSVFINDENFCRISGKPSRYHNGRDRNIGGVIRNFFSGLDSQASVRISRNLVMMGSTRTPGAEEPGESATKLVIQVTNTQVLSSLTCERRVQAVISKM